MSNELEKKESSQAIEVVELEDTVLDAAVGGVYSPSVVAINGHCPVTTNSAAGCGTSNTPA